MVRTATGIAGLLSMLAVLAVAMTVGASTASGAGAAVEEAGGNVAAAGEAFSGTDEAPADLPAPVRQSRPREIAHPATFSELSESDVAQALRLAAEAQREIDRRARLEELDGSGGSSRGFWGFMSQAFAVLTGLGGIVGGFYFASRRKGG